MRKVLWLSSLTAVSLFATNGDNLIGVGTESRAMGGVGVGMNVGTDNVFRNPAWIVDLKGFNASFGATAFMPQVSASVGPLTGVGNGVSADSKADFSVIPSVSHSDHINENLSYGVGMFGVSGMGVDYRNEDPNKGLADMRTSFQYMRFVPSLSYKYEDFRIGAGLSMAYGALNISANMPSDPTDPTTAAQRGSGVSEAYGFGAQLGLGYYILPELTIGAYYQSKVATKYEDVFDFDAGNMQNGYDDLKLYQPAEAGFGIGYTSSCDCYAISFDYRRIFWSDAEGYDVFGWEDQDVFAIGGSMKVDQVELRAGYNYAQSPLHNKTFEAATVAGVPMYAANIAYFNTLGFPAYAEQHFTLGLGYPLSTTTSLDLAYVYAPKVTESMDAFGTGSDNLEASNEQTAVSMTLKFSF